MKNKSIIKVVANQFRFDRLINQVGMHDIKKELIMQYIFFLRYEKNAGISFT